MAGSNFTRQQIPRTAVSPHLAAKFSYSTLQEGFVPFPKRLLRSLSTVMDAQHGEYDELSVLLALVDNLRPDAEPTLSWEFLVFLSGVSRTRAEECMSSLANKRLLTAEALDGWVRYSLKGLEEKIQNATADSPSGDIPF